MLRGCLSFFFFCNATATTEIYTLSLHDALPISLTARRRRRSVTWATPTPRRACPDRKSTRLNSSHLGISYAVFCLKKKNAYVATTPTAESTVVWTSGSSVPLLLEWHIRLGRAVE